MLFTLKQCQSLSNLCFPQSFSRDIFEKIPEIYCFYSLLAFHDKSWGHVSPCGRRITLNNQGNMGPRVSRQQIPTENFESLNVRRKLMDESKQPWSPFLCLLLMDVNISSCVVTVSAIISTDRKCTEGHFVFGSAALCSVFERRTHSWLPFAYLSHDSASHAAWAGLGPPPGPAGYSPVSIALFDSPSGALSCLGAHSRDPSLSLFLFGTLNPALPAALTPHHQASENPSSTG